MDEDEGGDDFRPSAAKRRPLTLFFRPQFPQPHRPTVPFRGLVPAGRKWYPGRAKTKEVPDVATHDAPTVRCPNHDGGDGRGGGPTGAGRAGRQ
ncbi:MAG: hypothetical protein AMXMBFR83_07290 [Phycisphaerae bacterium]